MTEPNGDLTGLSRRTYLKGIGLAGLASVSSGTGAALLEDADTVSVGSGSYATTKPNGVPSPPTGDQVFATDDVAAPFPSSGWWHRELYGTDKNWWDGPYQYGFGIINADPVIADTIESGSGFYTWYGEDWGSDPATSGNVGIDYASLPGLAVGHASVSEFSDTRTGGYGDWHTTVEWGHDVDAGLRATFVKGSPFVFCEFEGGEATLELVDNEESAVGTDSASVFYDDGNVLGVTVQANGATKHYGVFAPSAVTFDGVADGALDANPLTTNGLPDSGGYLTVAVLPDSTSGTVQEFARYAYNLVRDTTVDWEYVTDDGGPTSAVETTFTFDVERKSESAESGTLAWLFPHQWKYTDATLRDRETFSARGSLKLFSGSSFTTRKEFPGVLPTLPNDVLTSDQQSNLAGYVDGLINYDGDGDGTRDAYSWDVPDDTYWVGKDLYRNAMAAPIADQTGHEDAGWLLDAVRLRLESWFDAAGTSFTLDGVEYDTTDGNGNSRELLYYEPEIGTLIGYPSSEFWFARAMNDHHFHYGYFVRAAAEVARQNPGWVDEYGDMVELLIRDYANWERPANDGTPGSTTPIDGTTPKESPKDAFPFLRNFDPYSGHSWAGGLGSWNGNNQESSSEAVNSYAAMIMWGEITGNQQLRDAGIYLYTEEIHSVWEYWFDAAGDSLPDSWGEEVTDASFAPTGSTFEYATKVRGIGYDRNVFWSATEPIEHFGINWLPMGGHSFYLADDRAYATANWSNLLEARRRDEDVSGEPDENFLAGWNAVAWGYRAMSDPDDAARLADAVMTTGDPLLEDGGNSGPFAYQFVHALEQAGWPATDVNADHPFHQVFEDGSERTYVAYNASDTETTVSFTDGFSMTVPANTLGVEASAANYSPDTTAPDQPANVSVDGTTYKTVDLSWDAVADEDSGLSHYEVLVDGTSEREVPTPGVTLSDLSPGTEYELGVRAVDLSGNASTTATTTATTDSAETAVPPAPENPFAIEWTASSVELAWTPLSDVDFGVDHYNVYVDGEKQAEASSPPTTVTGLSGDTVDIQVSVVNGSPASNESELTDAISVTLADPAENEPFFSDPQPLPGRLELEYYDKGGTNVAYRDTTEGQGEYAGAYRTDQSVGMGGDSPSGYNLSYTAQYEWIEYTVSVESAGTYEIVGAYANNSGSAGGPVQLEIDDEPVGEPFEIPQSGSWTDFTKGTLGTVDLPAGTHVLRLYQQGGGFNLDYLEFRMDGGDDAAPTAPTNLAAETGESTVDLSWDAATDEESSIFLYHVYEGGYSEDGSPDATVSSTTATVEDLVSGTEYTFAVTAQDAFGNESGPVSTTVSTDLPENDTTPPAAPSDLRVVNRTQASMGLAWGAATDNVGVDHYVVSVDGEPVTETARTWATVGGLSSSRTYDISVSAVDADGNEGDAASIVATTADRTGQAPFSDPIEVPGPVKVEDVDAGGQGVAYYDTTPGNEVNKKWNAGIEMRDETDIDYGAVDGDYNAGYIAAGEWMEFTIEVPETGLYNVAYEVAAGPSGGGTFHLSVDGVDVTGAVSVSPTGGWSTYATQGPIEEIPLTAGTHVLRFRTGTGGFNLDQFSVSMATGSNLDRSAWTVDPMAAYHDTNGQRAIDGDPSTEWASNIPFAETAITYAVDMGSVHDLATITISHLGDPQAPAQLDVQVSEDGSDWETVTTVEGAKTTVAQLGGVSTRYFRLVDRDETSTNWWKITDIQAAPVSGTLSEDDTAPAAPSGLSVVETTGHQVELTWDGSGAEDLGHYAVSVDGEVARRVTGTSATVADLTPGTTYDIAVTAVDDAGNESSAATTTAETRIGVDFEHSATETAPSTLRIEFAPVVDGRDPSLVADADLTYRVNDGAEQTAEMVRGADAWYVVLGSLSAGDSVSYAVEYARAGHSRRTETFSHSFAGDDGDGIESLSVAESGPVSVTLSWTATGLSGVSEFVVREGGETVARADAGASELQVTGLSPDTRYTFEVVAITDGEPGQASNTVTVRTPSYDLDTARTVVDAWLDESIPVPIPLEELDFWTVREAAAGTEGEQ